MEKNVAILMADISGYSALTEIHGAQKAVEIIQQYENIVTGALQGESYILERVGDQVVVVSPFASDIAKTALAILDNTKKADRFPSVHAGLHYGAVLEMDGHFYGSTINIAARIAAKAKAGKILSSGDFINALGGSTLLSYRQYGQLKFKNITERVEIFELVQKNKTSIIDPVCQMQLDISEGNLSAQTETGKIYFCSRDCFNLYTSNLEEFLALAS